MKQVTSYTKHEHKKPYHDLRAWKQAHVFVIDIYVATKSYPNHEKYGLVSQLRRAASSVAANIVEGSMRRTNKDFLRFLYISKSSLGECEYFLELSRDLKYISKEKYAFLDEKRSYVGAPLQGLIGYIEAKT